MHEMSLMAGIFQIIEEYTADLSNIRVTRVTLVVGELTNTVPDALNAAFAVYSKGTVVSGAQLEIKTVSLTARCPDCGWKGNIEKYLFVCPLCSSLGIEIITGRELFVESLEVE